MKRGHLGIAVLIALVLWAFIAAVVWAVWSVVGS